MAKSNLRFDPEDQQYYSRHGKPVDGRDLVDAHTEAIRDRMKANALELMPAAQKFVDGKIDQDEWEAEVKAYGDAQAAFIKGTRLASTYVAVGGAENMTAVDNGRVGGILRQDYKDLNGMLADVLNDPRIVLGTAERRMDFETRSGMYADRNVEMFERTRNAKCKAVGLTRIENILDTSSDNCTGENSCKALTDMGEMDIDDPRWIVQGKRKCKGRCRCKSKRSRPREANVTT